MLQATDLGYLDTLENYMQIIVIPLIAIIIAIRLKREKKQTEQLNIIRLIILLVFVSFTYLISVEFIYQETAIGNYISEEIYGSNSLTFSLYNLGLVLYANQIESMYLFPYFAFGGMILFFLFTGFGEWIMWYIYISSIIGLSFLYLTSFRIKDNGSLGIAIFFTMAFATLFMSELDYAGNITSLIYCCFGIIFALGLFKPFKEIEIQGEVEYDGN